MANGTARSLFSGSNDDMVVLPRILTLRLGNFLFNIERIALLLLAYVAESLCASHGHNILGSVAYVIWLGLVALIIVDFVRTFLLHLPPVAGGFNVDKGHFVPKWYARLLAIIGLVLVAISVVALF
ncbi:MAG: hypothetical protein H6797_03420 [Candidatus Nomurabacteria bacterium]|nr:MAG: hypothetical protein H6797_03420 [Candidatus Nomurabacteria bacterium]